MEWVLIDRVLVTQRRMAVAGLPHPLLVMVMLAMARSDPVISQRELMVQVGRVVEGRRHLTRAGVRVYARLLHGVQRNVVVS